MKDRILSKIVLALSILLLSVIVIMPKEVLFAAPGTDVETVSAGGTNGTITVSGTAQDGVYAVAVLVYDSSDTLVAMSTCAANNNVYSVSIAVPNGTYTVKAANYDGGTYVETTGDVVVYNPPVPPTPAGDAGSASNSTPTPQVTPTAEVEPVVPVAETPVQTVSPKTNDGMGILVALAAVALIAYTGYFVKRRA